MHKHTVQITVSVKIQAGVVSDDVTVAHLDAMVDRAIEAVGKHDIVGTYVLDGTWRKEK